MNQNNIDALSSAKYDILVIGGGIYGIMLTLEATLRGLKPLLIEKGDFGGETSWNSLKVIHGGLRYLQTLDFSRFQESVGERKWFLRNFPDLVDVLPCLMPLYNRGIHRTYILRSALLLNDMLSSKRNQDVAKSHGIPAGKILSSDEVQNHFPLVLREGLRGGAMWYDGVMINAQRLMIELLHWACSYGAKVVNYTEAKRIIVDKNSVEGVEVEDKESSLHYSLSSDIVVNCAGPWSRNLLQTIDRDIPQLFSPILACNVLLKRETIADCALGIFPKKSPKNSQKAFFLLPYKNHLLAGTWYSIWKEKIQSPRPDKEAVELFLRQLNEAIPLLRVNMGHVMWIFSGLLPEKEYNPGYPSDREVIIDHKQRGGPSGLYSVSGVKFTTARLVAEKTLGVINREWASPVPYATSTKKRPPPVIYPSLSEYKETWQGDKEKMQELKSYIEREQVTHLDDLCLRRTDWIHDTIYSHDILRNILTLFPWNADRKQQELKRMFSYSPENMMGNCNSKK